MSGWFAASGRYFLSRHSENALQITRVAVGVTANLSNSSSAAHATSVASPPAIGLPAVRSHRKSTITKWKRGRWRSSEWSRIHPRRAQIDSFKNFNQFQDISSSPVSSFSSRAVPSASVSPSSSVPPGIDHWPNNGSVPRRLQRPTIFDDYLPTPTIGRSGYSRHEPFGSRFPFDLPIPGIRCCTQTLHFFMDTLTSALRGI
jgi:hypothetical protein